MNKTRALYRAFGSNLEMPKPDQDIRKKLYSRFGMVAFIGIMIPVSVIAGYMTYVMTDMLYRFGGSTYALLTELDLLSAFAMIFGLPLMFSVLFFSSDLRFLTALPISPVSIFNARLLHTYRAENVMTGNALFAIYIGFFVAAVKHEGIAALHPVAILGTLLGYIGCLFVPLICCAVLAMLLILIIRNEKVYYHISAILFVAFSAVIVWSMSDYGNIGARSFLQSLIEGDNRFVVLCNFLFPTNALTIRAVEHHEILPLILACLIFAAVYLLSLSISKISYRRGLFIAATLGGKKAGRHAGSLRSGPHSKMTSLFIKELRVLMRTMTYRMNCIYVNLIWIIAAVAVGVMSRGGVLGGVTERLRDGDPQIRTVVLIIMIAASFIASGLNSIASTSFTREGAHLDLIKYLPADLKIQIRAKALVSIFISFVPLAAAVIIMTILTGTPLLMCLYIPVALMCCLIACIIGMTMDSIAPYTIWSDELSALRGNLNCFFNLAAELIVALFVGASAYGLFLLLENETAVIFGVLLILAAASVWSVVKGPHKIARNIGDLR